MKKILSALQPLFMGGGFLLLFILFTYVWQTNPVLSFIRPHPLYFIGIVLLIVSIAVVLIGLRDIKKLRLLPEKERNAFILKSKKNVRKKLRFTLLALAALIAVMLFYIFFIQDKKGFFIIICPINSFYILSIIYRFCFFLFYVVKI